MDLYQLLMVGMKDNLIALFLLAAIVYLIKEITRLNLIIAETRKEKDGIVISYLERVLAAVERLDLPGPK